MAKIVQKHNVLHVFQEWRGVGFIPNTSNINKNYANLYLFLLCLDAGRGVSPSEENAQLKEAKKKLQKELTTMKIRIGMSEGEKKTLNQKVRNLFSLFF